MRLALILMIASSCSVAVAQQPALILPLGHAGELTSATFSHDDKLVVTGSLDKTAIVWETFSGKKLRQLGLAQSKIDYAFFSDDDRYIAVGTDSTVALWSVPDYRLIYSSHLAKKVMFSPDTKRFFVVDFAGTIRQISLATFKIEFTYKDSALLNSVNISEDGKLLCSGKDSSLTVRDIKTGKVIIRKKTAGDVLTSFFMPDRHYLLTVTNKGLQRFDIGNNFFALNWIYHPCSLAFLSNNHRFLLTAYEVNDQSATLWDLEKYRIVFESAGVFSVRDSVPVFDVQGNIAGYKGGTYPFSFPRLLYRPQRIEISNDGKFLRSSNLLWNVLDGKKTIEVPGLFVNLANFNSDSKYLMIQPKEGVGALMETESGRIVQTYRTHADDIRSVDISPDGKHFLISGYDSSVRIIETATAKTDFILKNHKDVVRTADFNSSGSQVLTNSNDSTAKLWDMTDGSLIRTYNRQIADNNPAYFSIEDTVVTPVLQVETLQVFNIDGEPRDTVILAESENPALVRSRTSKTGRYKLRNVDELLLLDDSFGENNLSFHGFFNVNAFSPDEKLLAMAAMHEDTLVLIDIEKNKPVFAGSLHMDSATNQFGKAILQLLFTDKYLLVADGSAVVHVFSKTTGQQLFKLPGYHCAVSADYKWLVVANQGQCDVYDFEKRKLLYHYISLQHENFLVIDSSYRFDGTDNARKELYYVCGNEVIDLEQIKALSWEPALASKITKVNREPITAKKLSEIDICNFAPQTETLSSPQGKFNFKVKPQRGGLGEVQLFVNSKLVKRYNPASLRKDGSNYYLSVVQPEIDSFFIAGAKNNVTIKATTIDGGLISRGAGIDNVNDPVDTIPPDLYLLSIGISEYNDSSLSLRYPSRDAAAFAGAVSMSARKLLNVGGKEHVFTWTLNSAAKEGSLKPTKKSITTVLSAIGERAKANDILVVFFAGHGVAPAGQKSLFLPTANASSLKQLETMPKEVAISFDELMDWLRHIKANKEIVVLDVCNAGIAVQNLESLVKREIPADQERAIDNLATTTGSCVLAASAADQPAYETSLYEHGLLTQSLLSGIKLGRGLRDNKFIRVNRWFDIAAEQVKVMAMEIGARQDPKVFGNAGFDLGIADQEVSDSIHLSDRKKIFSLSNLVIDGPNPHDNVLGLSALVKNKLKGFVTRGEENPFEFLQDNPSPEAYAVTGKYSITGTEVTVHVYLMQNELKDYPVYKFDITGTTDNKDALAENIVQKIRSFLETKK